MAKALGKVDGIILLDKPLGLSSNQALQQVRWLFKAEKAGHTGSLDPLATGMLPICFGEASKVSAFLLDSDKTYLTIAQLGKITTTADAEGEVLQTRAIPSLSPERIEAVLANFRGVIQQVPPMYSALKKDGKPLYELARQGIEVARVERQITIHQLELVSYTEDTLHLRVHCSKGTYIRSLVQDIGEALTCGAYVAALRRTSVTPFDPAAMQTMEQLQALAENDPFELHKLLLAPDVALQALPQWTLANEAQIWRLRHGKALAWPERLPVLPLLRLYSATGEFIGVGEWRKGQLRAKRLMAYDPNEHGE
ncbi:tRNA pseudouridine(55) synthase TruB [Thiolinea disciformis]|uniref:tRNA pseudouridine(55) synthase TruB n=1 Tax=Thiolinea disciformis TaxID=125614 RepID=UPI000382ECB7|nr:tRNA pseudouridine(55) synthase TruB [Thiolinea disciformis]